MAMNNGGPQWASPEAPVGVSQQEAEFFAPLSTLDEPVRETIMRDVRSVASKLKVVLLPMDRSVSPRSLFPTNQRTRVCSLTFSSP